MTFTRKYLLLFVTLLSIKGFSQVKFYAETPNKIIGKNDYLQLNFTVDNANKVDDITPPTFKNFQLISGPSQQSSMTSFNGSIKRSVSLVFVLKPLAIGAFTIGSATASADGHEYHSDPITIKVTKSSSASTNNQPISPFFNLTLDELDVPSTHAYDDYILKKGEKIEDKIKKNLFVKLDVSKTTCYVGEPIVATYKIYSRLKSESSVQKMPSFNGFSVTDLGNPESFALINEKYNGREYNVYILRKVQLYPLQPGNITLEPAEVENKITFIKAPDAQAKNRPGLYDLLHDFADDNLVNADIIPEKVIVKSLPETIKVLPLPVENKPIGFKGAIGDFKISATLEKNNITTGDAGNLIIKIGGSGNIQLVNSPVVSSPGLQFFEPITKEDIDKAAIPMKGSKTFSYPFTVTNTGSYTILPIEFSFFDKISNTYKTIKTSSLTLLVDKATGSKQSKDITDIKYFTPNIFNQFKWSIISGVALLIVLIIWFNKSRKKADKLIYEGRSTKSDVKEIPIVNDSIIIRNPLADAEELLSRNDIEHFYSKLNYSLRNYLSEKLGVQAEELTRKRITELLDNYNVGVGTTLLLSSLMENIEICLYASVIADQQVRSDYEKANEVISLLGKQLSHASVNL